MIGPYLKSALTPTVGKLGKFSQEKGITALHLNVTVWASGIATLVALGLQYFMTGIAFFLLHRLTIEMLETRCQKKENLFRDYFVITGSLMAMLWTAGDHALPVAFLFWAIMMNLLGILSFKPAFIVIGLAEISTILILIALAPAYLPAIAILFGAACLISLCASYLQTFRKSV